MRTFIRELAGQSDNRTQKRPNDRRGQHNRPGEGVQHAGLVLQRYLCENATGEGGNPEEKRAILNAAINAASSAEVNELYKIAFNRWCSSLPKICEAGDIRSLGRLIVGLGNENVLETGIRLHHTYGMPILPGSALKGLAAHYCSQVLGEQDDPKFKKPTTAQDETYKAFLSGMGAKPDDNYHRLLFGITDDSGCITFHDAWITPDSKEPLKLDVMTPHHPKWINGAVPPTDFDSPIPIPFLSVSGSFHFALSWHGPDSDKSAAWVEFAFKLLCDALEHWGIGGKTSSGYGRFDLDDFHSRKQKERDEKAKRDEQELLKAELETMSPIERSIREFVGSHPNIQDPEYMKLLKELEKNENCRWKSDEEKRIVAERVKQGMIDLKKWGKKDKDAIRTAFIKNILGE